MRWLTVCLCVVLVGISLSGCTKPQKLHEDVLTNAGLQTYWELQLILAEDESIAEIHRVDDTLYCLTDRNTLIAIDALKGRREWTRRIAQPGQPVFAPTHADRVLLADKVTGVAGITDPSKAPVPNVYDTVMINTLSHVLVMDRTNGRIIRKIAFDFAANTNGSSDGKYFYVGSTRGWYYAILLAEAVKGWWLSADGMISAPVKLFGNRLYVADEVGNFIITTTGRKGEKLRTVKLSGSVTAEFHVDAVGCFVPSDDNRLYAFDLSGNRLWEQPFVCQGPLRQGVQVVNDTIFQFASNDKFYAIDRRTGQARWSHPTARRVLAAIDGDVYLLNESNSLMIVDELRGTVKMSFPMTGWDLLLSNSSAPAIYVATTDGKLACIRKISAGRLTPQMFENR